jgi:hypothetical protein
MKLIAHIVISAVAGLAGFLASALGVVAVQTAIHGGQAFEHDAGADFGLFILVLVAIPASILCFILAFHRLQRKRISSFISN